MGDIQVRPASEDDIGALCTLYEEFQEFHVRGVPDRLASLQGSDPGRRADLAARLRDLIGGEQSAVLVAEQRNQVIGLAEVYLREDDHAPGKIPRRFGYLQSMVVTDECRRQGAGSRLLGAAEAWAVGRGATEMRLDIWEFPQGPLRFYEHCGYRTLRRTLVRSLE
jgi:GNAT superfamily N-acetyltransferase